MKKIKNEIYKDVLLLSLFHSPESFKAQVIFSHYDLKLIKLILKQTDKLKGIKKTSLLSRRNDNVSENTVVSIAKTLLPQGLQRG